ncbi:unnamed protein product, partial [Clonostachys rosea]
IQSLFLRSLSYFLNNMETYSTIFKLLTCPNPTVQQENPRAGIPMKTKGMSNTTSKKYYTPKQIIKWEEFENLQCLREAFGGELFAEAHREGRQFRVPLIRPTDCRVDSEKRATELFNKWNKEIVMTALDPILDTFRPAIWAQGDNITGIVMDAPKPQVESTRKQPVRSCVPKRPSSVRNLLDRLEPDSGSVPSHPSSPEEIGKEKFLKEFKMAAKWKSRWIFQKQIVDETGLWMKDGTRQSAAWPIRQTFTYCVKYSCRYACIITCEEVFIFRVRPRVEIPDPKDPEVLKKVLAENGLMEYVSIPWDNHCQGDPKDYEKWTMNLALWFVHVLAGMDSDVRCVYKDLREETVLPTQHLELPDQQPPPAGEVPSDNSEVPAEEG